MNAGPLAARGDFADVSRLSAPPFVSSVREDVNVIGAIVSREDPKARIKVARYTTAKISKAIQWNNQLSITEGKRFQFSHITVIE